MKGLVLVLGVCFIVAGKTLLGLGMGIWVCFAVGQTLNILKHANLSASSKLSGTQSSAHYIHTNFTGIMIRVFASTMLLTIWASHPDLLGTVGIPLTAGTAGLGGLFSDVVLDFVLAKFGVNNELPPVK